MERIMDRLHGIEGLLQIIQEASESGTGECLTNAIGATLDYLRETIMQIENN